MASAENLSEPGHGHFETITQHSSLFTACADGKIPWVSANDIAAVAFRCLTDEKPHNRAYRILGPQLLSYDEVCFSPSLFRRNLREIKVLTDSPDCRKALQPPRQEDNACALGARAKGAKYEECRITRIHGEVLDRA